MRLDVGEGLNMVGEFYRLAAGWLRITPDFEDPGMGSETVVTKGLFPKYPYEWTY